MTTRENRSIYYVSAGNQLDKHNRLPVPPAPEYREVFDLLIRNYEGRGCTFTYEDIVWEGKTVPGVVMTGSIVPEQFWECVLAPDNPMWKKKNGTQPQG